MPRVVEPPTGPLPLEAASNGCFETMRAYGGRIFRLEGHLNRLYASAQSLGTRPPADRAQLGRQLVRALARSRLQDAVVRLSELDGALKGQSRLAPDLELQRALADLTRRPGAARGVVDA